jgi:hypothetical protein
MAQNLTGDLAPAPSPLCVSAYGPTSLWELVPHGATSLLSPFSRTGSKAYTHRARAMVPHLPGDLTPSATTFPGATSPGARACRRPWRGS